MNDIIAIKIGTSSLLHTNGSLNLRKIEKVIKVISDLQNGGKKVVFISSGAIAAGCAKLGLDVRPADTPARQATAAVGQCELMQIYDRLFGFYNHTVAQVLLTKDVIEDETRKQNVVNTFKQLLKFNVIPIVNENDTVSIDELEGANFGDNDTLSAIVAIVSGAKRLIILSDIDGLYDSDPRTNSNAALIETVPEITSEIKNLAGGVGSSFGTGGMATKVKAAEITASAGIYMHIINGDKPEKIYDLLEGKPVGTVFLPNVNNA